MFSKFTITLSWKTNSYGTKRSGSKSRFFFPYKSIFFYVILMVI